MAQAKRKNTTAFLKTADAKLNKLHDEFCRAYAAVLKCQDGGQSYSQRCSLPIQRNREKASTRESDAGIFKQPGPISDMAKPAVQPNWAVSRSRLRRKVLEFRAVLKDRMTQRERIAFAGASASLRRNKEKERRLCHRHKGEHHA